MEVKVNALLPVGYQLVNSHTIGDDDVYTIEQVVDGHPLWPGQPVPRGAKREPVLGKGGFGITYLASRQIKIGAHDTHKIYYAIKEYFVSDHCWRQDGKAMVSFNPSSPEAKEGMKEFKSEAERLKTLCGKNSGIVKVHDVFEANGTAYYVMEYLNGGSLRDRVKELHPDVMSEEQVKTLMLPVLHTVQKLHAEKLLHCDIKPENIMLQIASNGQESPVLIDFGETMHFNKSGLPTTTRRVSGGTIGYMPIEQSNGIRKFDPRYDIYALGATMYHLLVGKRPVDAFDMTADILERDLPPTISPRFRNAIKHAMAKLPEDRTPTIEDFIREIGDVYVDPDAPLVPGYLMHHGAYDYRVVKMERRTPEYIVYRVIRFPHNSKTESTIHTEAFPYVLYEFFEQGVAKRQEENEVTDVSRSSEAYVNFLHLNSLNKSKSGYAAFEANGTEYFVHMRELTPPWYTRAQKQLTDVLSVLPYRQMGYAFGIAACAALLYFSWPSIQSSISSWSQTKPDSVRDTVVAPPLPEPIAAVENYDFDAIARIKNLKVNSVVKKLGMYNYKYTGEVTPDTIPNGRGIAVFADGSKYEGHFVKGVPQDDNATYYNAKDRSVFEGKISDFLYVEGELTLHDNQVFVGKFKDGSPDNDNGKWYGPEAAKADYALKMAGR